MKPITLRSKLALAGEACPLQLLIVEDDPDDLAIIAATLFEFPHPLAMSFVSTAEEAWNLITGDDAEYGSGSELCMVIVDARLPGMSGLELILKLRREERFCMVPLIAMSNVRDVRSIDDAYRAGCNSFVEKSADPATYRRDLMSAAKYWICTNYQGSARGLTPAQRSQVRSA